MCSRLVSSTKKVFRFSSIGCHATYSQTVVSPRHIEKFALQHRMKAVVYVIETHANGDPHTHIVWYAYEKTLWGSDLLDEVADGVHLTRLRTERDVLVCMSYLCKEFTPTVWTNPNMPPCKIKEQILDAIWVRNHNPRYPGQASLVYEEAYARCRRAWLPTEEEGASQDPVCSEDPDKYFK